MKKRTPVPRLRVLHLHSSFDPGGKEMRAVQLINAFGPQVAHSIVSAVPGALGAARAIDPAIPVDYPEFPELTGKPFPRRLQELARAMIGFDLVLTYNWGAMDAVLAHTAFAEVLKLPPLIHHEDGFNQDEAVRLKWHRNLFRRIALFRAQRLVVPSQRLEHIARTAWKQPAAMVKRIPNGIAVFAYGRKPKPDVLPRVIKHPGELWLGTLAGLRAVKNLPRLVRAFAPLPEAWQLVILGEGPEREAIRAEAVRLGVGHRVHLPGHVAHPAQAMGLFDLFALSSDSEQFPISVVEAMASGLAIAAPRVGDIEAMVAGENCRFLSPPGDEAALSQALLALAEDADLRASIGKANRTRAEAEYDEAKMITAYRNLYAGALGRTAFP
ncbi:glycosyltransferase family 4 protein [Novosphingobium ginsenosidimutans]|uniref:Glycosyltransferase family 4 protein n=1 Tax=Novosphingobium ginsenosidimutans TaxID=1176536 RepID=A0A5B8S1Y4_9SPHN|nr:glycosyltransferase family 4 protein [Novosphingobium ginsenosidimutans]QEA15062.1 glycosyltransferase family 4 protein [Novosphingobium ginsenosidimutans]